MPGLRKKGKGGEDYHAFAYRQPTIKGSSDSIVEANGWRKPGDHGWMNGSCRINIEAGKIKEKADKILKKITTIKQMLGVKK